MWVKQITNVELPDGIYSGLMSGYEFKFILENKETVITLDEGVRGLNIPTNLTISDNDIVKIDYD